jgi:hypothetical protein
MILTRYIYPVLLYVAFCFAEESGPALYSASKWVALETIAKPNYPPPTSDNWKQPTTEIYISIADFTDTIRCAKTLDNYISKAKYPKRLKFGMRTQRPYINMNIITMKQESWSKLRWKMARKLTIAY